MHRSIQVVEKRERIQREAKEQAAFFEWRDNVRNMYPGIHLMFAIPNGAFLQGDRVRRAKQWSKLKRQGSREGVSDVFLPVPRGGYHGLWIEIKAPRPHASEVSDDQEQWQKEMRGQGYLAVVAYGSKEACDAVTSYYRLEC
jgi:hypothetical protein